MGLQGSSGQGSGRSTEIRHYNVTNKGNSGHGNGRSAEI